MRHVRYTGQDPTLRKGCTALMREDGKVQLDGPTDFWRSPTFCDQRCFGWHYLGEEWEDIQESDYPCID